MKIKNKIYIFGIIILFPAIFLKCGSSQITENDTGRHTLLPGISRIGKSAKKAAFSPLTWIPAAALTGVYFSGKDQAISGWASLNTPVFGSNENAGEFSNYFQSAIRASCYTAMGGHILTHYYSSGEFWCPAAATIASWAVSISGTYLITNHIKEKTGRERPDSQDYLSFFSLHASNSVACGTLAARNIDLLPIHPAASYFWQIATYTLAAGVSWARVEAKKHYLTDVLAGWVAGNLISEFVCGIFLPEKSEYNRVRLEMAINPIPGHINFVIGFNMPVLL